MPIRCDTSCRLEAARSADLAGKKRSAETDDIADQAFDTRRTKAGTSKGGGSNSARQNKDAVNDAVRPSDETRRQARADLTAKAQDEITRRQAVADLKAANMCWDKFKKTTQGVCKRYGGKCLVPGAARLLCPDCKITFHPFCVLKMDKIKTAFCPCHPQEGVTPPS